jgi:Flp pilus assembly protein TadD
MTEPGRLNDALAELTEAARLKPDDPEVRSKLDEVREQISKRAP